MDRWMQKPPSLPGIPEEEHPSHKPLPASPNEDLQGFSTSGEPVDSHSCPPTPPRDPPGPPSSPREVGIPPELIPRLFQRHSQFSPHPRGPHTRSGHPRNDPKVVPGGTAPLPSRPSAPANWKASGEAIPAGGAAPGMSPSAREAQPERLDPFQEPVPRPLSPLWLTPGRPRAAIPLPARAESRWSVPESNYRSRRAAGASRKIIMDPKEPLERPGK